MRRIVFMAITALFLARSAGAQFVVIDPANLVQTILIADRTLNEYETLFQQYETIVRMARSLGSLDRYRIPGIAITGHDPSRWPYGALWLQGLNAGDARGTLYEQVARRLERPGSALDSLPASAQKAIQDAYATIEITDSIAEIGGHQVALVRGYNGVLQDLVQEFERDVLSGLPQYHDMTAILDKVAAGELLARRQDMATNQLLSHALEQLLARSKRTRDTEAASMNMRLLGMRDGRTAGAALIQGAADDLRNWRQP
jgi:hypothetical protein